MSQNVGWATLGVIPSMKGFREHLERETRPQFARAGMAGGKDLGDAAGKEFSSTFMDRISADTKGMVGGLLAAGGLAAGIRDIYNASSEAQQSIGAVQAVYKGYADGVLSDSEKAAEGLGLSAHAYRELVTVSGSLLKNKGMADFAAQAKNLIGVGADLAAQYGGPTSQAVEALNAAMRGESDPIERYAISLSDAAVQSWLAANGMKGLKGAAEEQAKTQARLALIMQQSSDAQGAFAREAGTAQNEAQKLAAEWKNLTTAAGDRLLPAATDLFKTLREDGLPALESAGSATATLASGVAGLPGPVKDAALAFAALKAANAVGLTAGIAAGSERGGRAMEQLRHSVTTTSDAYRTARPHLGAFNASLAASSALTSSATRGMRAGLGSLSTFVGGPWGAALMVGAGTLGHFWREQQKGKTHVAALTAALKDQQGQFNEQNRGAIVDILQSEDVGDGKTLERAREHGIALDLVTDAAMGNANAMAKLREQALTKMPTGDLRPFLSALEDQDGALAKARNAYDDYQQAMGNGAATFANTANSTFGVAAAMEEYRDKVGEARGALRDLIESERDRASDAIKARGDELGIAQQLADARKDMMSGAGIGLADDKGRKNYGELLDLANQWTSSADEVKGKKGAYESFRQEFLNVAEAMKVPKKEAGKLAEELLAVPQSAPIRFQTEGFKQARDEIRELKEELSALRGQKEREPHMNAWRLTEGAAEWTTAPAPYAPGSMINIEGDVRPADSREFYADLTRRSRKKGAGGVAKP